MIWLIAAVAAGVLLMSNQGDSQDEKSDSRIYDLPDIAPDEQGGTYKRDYDFFFEHYADETGVPFALLKAHSIMESSLNPDAYVNENPKNRDDRKGWASRGLMQILWWPKSNRFAKYGYPDSLVGDNGENLFEPNINVAIAANLIRENLNRCNGNLRDAINMYNTGKKEADFQAPGDYVNKVIKFYSTLIKRSPL